MTRYADGTDKHDPSACSPQFLDQSPQFLEPALDREPVLNVGLPREDRKAVGRDLASVQLKRPNSIAVVRPLEPHWSEGGNSLPENASHVLGHARRQLIRRPRSLH